MSRYCAGVKLCEGCSTKVGLAKRAKEARRKMKALPESVVHHDEVRAEEKHEAEEIKTEVWTVVLFRAKGRCESCSKTRWLEPHHLILGSRDDAPEVVMALCEECHRTGPKSAHRAPRLFALTVVIPWAKAHGFPIPNRKEYRP